MTDAARADVELSKNIKSPIPLTEEAMKEVRAAAEAEVARQVKKATGRDYTIERYKGRYAKVYEPEPITPKAAAPEPPPTRRKK